MSTAHQKKIRILQQELKHALSTVARLEIQVKALSDGFLSLREAVDEAGYDVFLNGLQQPLANRDDLCVAELSRYFRET